MIEPWNHTSDGILINMSVLFYKLKAMTKKEFRYYNHILTLKWIGEIDAHKNRADADQLSETNT